jgi:NADH-quinone oxidoreductase subunit L
MSVIVVAVVAAGVGLAWWFVARRDVPRVAPQRVSFVTRAARADLYGDTLNEALLMRPGDQLVGSLVDFDDHGVDGVVNGTGSAALAMSGTFRRVQSGYVRSYALSVLAGALLVVLALLAVNFA